MFWWRAPPFSHTISVRVYYFVLNHPDIDRSLVLQMFTSLLGIKNDFIPSKQGFQEAKEHIESYPQTRVYSNVTIHRHDWVTSEILIWTLTLGIFGLWGGYLGDLCHLSQSSAMIPSFHPHSCADEVTYFSLRVDDSKRCSWRRLIFLMIFLTTHLMHNENNVIHLNDD